VAVVMQTPTRPPPDKCQL